MDELVLLERNGIGDSDKEIFEVRLLKKIQNGDFIWYLEDDELLFTIDIKTGTHIRYHVPTGVIDVWALDKQQRFHSFIVTYKWMQDLYEKAIKANLKEIPKLDMKTLFVWK